MSETMRAVVLERPGEALRVEELARREAARFRGAGPRGSPGVDDVDVD